MRKIILIYFILIAIVFSLIHILYYENKIDQVYKEAYA